jgi:hypothetical protein
MDGDVRIDLAKPMTAHTAVDPDKNGAVHIPANGIGPRMGWMKLKRGHQGMLPANSAYQFSSDAPSVMVLQTCKGELSIERWAAICQAK